jgi:ABC-2 type transport system permease protein
MIPAFGSGWLTLLYKELLRFWKVSFQTILAPVLSALLYLLIFSHVLESRVSVFDGRVTYTAFLIPGLVMMSVLQNSFANSSSSLTQSKITGNLIFVLLPPLSPLDLYGAYVLGAMVRGLVVGAGVFLITGVFAPLALLHPAWALAFALLGSAILGTLGLIAGIWADKFEQLAAFQNFLIVPLTFLSGVFYSIQSLPPFWGALSHFNPFFYMIDGFRYGFFGLSDVAPQLSLAIVCAFCLGLTAVALFLLKRGLPQPRQHWAASRHRYASIDTQPHAPITSDRPRHRHDHAGIHQTYHRGGPDLRARRRCR